MLGYRDNNYTITNATFSDPHFTLYVDAIFLTVSYSTKAKEINSQIKGEFYNFSSTQKFLKNVCTALDDMNGAP